MRFTIFLATAIIYAESAHAEEKPVEIPLKDVWALDMPGTRSIYELEPEIFDRFRKLPAVEQERLFDKSLIFQFGETLDYLPADQTAAKGFVVSGTAHEALARACRTRRKQDPPQKKLPEGSEITLVYFTHQKGSDLNLQTVTRSDGKIEVRYRLVPRDTQDLTAELALIPLGTLPIGQYRVEMVQSPIDKKYLDGGRTDRDMARVVCKSFSFEVTDK